MALSVVYTTAAKGNVASLLTLTVQATGSGNLLIVAVGNDDGRDVSSVTDGTHNFTQFESGTAWQPTRAGGVEKIDCWYLPSSTAGAVAIPITFSGTIPDDAFAVYWEVSGFTTPAEDGVQALSNQTATPPADDPGASLTTTGTVGFVIGYIGEDGGVPSQNPKSGNAFTAGGGTTSDSGGVSLISSAASTYQPIWVSDASHFCTFTAAWKESGGGGPTPDAPTVTDAITTGEAMTPLLLDLINVLE